MESTKRTKKKNQFSSYKNYQKLTKKYRSAILVNLQGGSLFSNFMKFHRIMGKFKKLSARVDKSSANLKKDKVTIDTWMGKYQKLDEDVAEGNNQLIEAIQRMKIHEIEREKISRDPERQHELLNYDSKIKNMMQKINVEENKLENSQKEDIKKFRNKYSNRDKKILKKINKFEKDFQDLTNFYGKHSEIINMKSEIDSYISGKTESEIKQMDKPFKSMYKKYKKNRSAYDKLASYFTAEKMNQNRENLNYIINVKQKTEAFKQHEQKLRDKGEKKRSFIDKWEKLSDKFVKNLVSFIDNKEVRELETILVKINEIKRRYIAARGINPNVNVIVMQFDKWQKILQEALSILREIGKSMESIKENFLNRVPAVKISMDEIILIEAHGRALSYISAVKNFIENYKNEKSWNKYFANPTSGGSILHKGGAVSTKISGIDVKNDIINEYNNGINNSDDAKKNTAINKLKQIFIHLGIDIEYYYKNYEKKLNIRNTGSDFRILPFYNIGCFQKANNDYEHISKYYKIIKSSINLYINNIFTLIPTNRERIYLFYLNKKRMKKQETQRIYWTIVIIKNTYFIVLI